MFTERSRAWLELSEIDDLIDRLLQHLGGFTESSLELYLASESLMPATSSDGLGCLGTVHEQAGRLVNITAHLLTSFLELERQVEGWEIGAVHGGKHQRGIHEANRAARGSKDEEGGQPLDLTPPT